MSSDSSESIVFESVESVSGMRKFAPDSSDTSEDLLRSSVEELQGFGYSASSRSEAGFLTLTEMVKAMRAHRSTSVDYGQTTSKLRERGFALLYSFVPESGDEDEAEEECYVFGMDPTVDGEAKDLHVALLPLEDDFLNTFGIRKEQVYILVLSSDEYQKVSDMLGDDSAQLSYINELSDEATAETIFYEVLRIAIRLGASDIHIEPVDTNWRIRLRVNGVLQELSQHLDLGLGAALVKVIQTSKAQMAFDHPSLPGDAYIRFSEADVEKMPHLAEHSLRVSCLPMDPTRGLTSVVMRILSKNPNIDFSIESLRFDQQTIDTILRIIGTRKGMLLVTGPTGSGKTTTLYTLLQHLNTPEIKIVTIEDPVEYKLPGMIQVPVDHKAGASFAKILRSTLRHDPEVVLIGEIRDFETAETAVEAANTGHLVLSTLHTNDAISAVTRIGTMDGISLAGFSSAIRGISAQRLIPLVCPSCSSIGDASSEINRLLALEEEDAIDFEIRLRYFGDELSRRACQRCYGSGIVGRQVIVEFWEPTEEDKTSIAHGKFDLASMRKRAYERGMNPIWLSALNLALRQECTLEDMLQSAAAEDLLANRKRILSALRTRNEK